MSSTKPRNVLCEAVRELRKVVGKGQMEFANQMSWHIVTLARYETNRPPKGRALAQLWRVANEHGEHDLARVFLGGFQDDMGEMVFTSPKGFAAAMYAFVDVLSLAEHEGKRKKILKLLEPEIERAKVVFSATELARHPEEAIGKSARGPGGEPGVLTWKIDTSKKGKKK